MVKNTTIWCRAFLIIISSLRVFLLDAQEVNLNNIALIDAKRTMSLLDTTKNLKSYTIRNSSVDFNANQFSWKKIKINTLSAYSVLQENSNLPLGYNDGVMHPSVGKQSYYNVQLGIQWGRFTLQLAPEKVVAENFAVDGLANDFDGSANGYPGNFWRRYYEISENIMKIQIDILPKRVTKTLLGNQV